MITDNQGDPALRPRRRGARRTMLSLLVALAVVVGLTSVASAPASAAPAVIGEINRKWTALGGAGGTLGQPLDIERPTFDGVGRKQEFERGTISWHPNVGAFSVIGSIRTRWIQLGREVFGYPSTDEGGTPDGRGRFNHFTAVHLSGAPRSSIYFTSQTGAVEVFGEIRRLWSSLGWERSSLGYPSAPERNRDGGVVGRQQSFQGGIAVWTPSDGAAIQVPKIDVTGTDGSDDITGHLQVVMFPNGNWEFRGHLHNSGFNPRDVTALLLVRSSSGQVFQFSITGHTGGTWDVGVSRDFDWSRSGSNPQIAAAWPGLSRGGTWSWKTRGDVNVTQAFKDAAEVVGTVAGVVAVIVAAV
jgi:hypothetical protein